MAEHDMKAPIREGMEHCASLGVFCTAMPNVETMRSGVRCRGRARAMIDLNWSFSHRSLTFVIWDSGTYLVAAGAVLGRVVRSDMNQNVSGLVVRA